MNTSLSYKRILDELIAFTILLLVFLYDAFQSMIGYLDELFALFSFLLILSTLLFKKVKLYQYELSIALYLILLLFLGLFSNFYSNRMGYKTHPIAITGDIINIYKPFIVYFALRFLNMKINSERIVRLLVKYSEVILIILIIFILIDLLFNVYPHYSRFGLESFQLFFKHASRFSFAISFIFILLFLKYYTTNKWVLFFILSIGLISLRVKFFVFYLITLILLFIGKNILKLKKPLLFFTMVVAILLISLIFKFQFEMYFSSGSGWSRGEILNTSFKIGSDFFPFGTGFGTYSSYFSGKYYSWVYELYDINKVYGISKEYWGFIADQFWPMVLGQFGYFGLIIYALIIYKFIMFFLKNLKACSHFKQRNYMYASLIGMLLLLIDSSSDAIFTQNRAVVIFALFALFTNSYKNYNVTTKH